MMMRDTLGKWLFGAVAIFAIAVVQPLASDVYEFLKSWLGDVDPITVGEKISSLFSDARFYTVFYFLVCSTIVYRRSFRGLFLEIRRSFISIFRFDTSKELVNLAPVLVVLSISMMFSSMFFTGIESFGFEGGDSRQVHWGFGILSMFAAIVGPFEISKCITWKRPGGLL